MRRTSLLATMALALIVPASASASGDAAATAAFVRANYALMRVAGAHLKTSAAGIDELEKRLSGECPDVAKGSPQNHLSEHLSNEAIGAMVIEAAKPDRAAALAFLKAVTPLHWSNAGLNHTMHAYITSLTKLSKLTVPDVCGDVKSWVASSYQTLPAATVSFVNVFVPNWVAFGFNPPALRRLESGSVKAMSVKAKRLEGKLSELEANEVDKWGDILNALELGP
ncbi:MAG TPA: hypothetical protein VGG08_01610 [Solirubrobacteraceae bacterium]|jgi:hypothetical protein